VLPDPEERVVCGVQTAVPDPVSMQKDAEQRKLAEIKKRQRVR
jgi:hypothetical protein